MLASREELEAGLDYVRSSPKDVGSVDLIVCRPDIGERRELGEGELDCQQGLLGDNWLARGFGKAPVGAAHPDMQLNIMNSRTIALIAKERQRWKLAGDQFYVDLDLSYDNVPPGIRLKLGEAVIEITAEPHLGCKKFMQRFGKEAALFVNSDEGKRLNLRGVNAKVVSGGRMRQGDLISKLL